MFMYNFYLQSLAEENYEVYKRTQHNQNYSRKKQSWDQLIKYIENDIHRHRFIAYKLMRHINNIEKCTTYINVMLEK